MGNAAIFFINTGREKDGDELLTRASGSDPLNPITFVNHAFFSICLGRLDEAEKQTQRAVELNPNSPPPLNALGDIALLRGQTERARELLMKYYKAVDAEDFGRPFVDALVEHTAGNETASRAAAAEFEKKFGA